MAAVQTAVLGVTGYAGAELARLLVRHPRLKGKAPIFAGRVEAEEGVPLRELHPQLVDSHGTGSLRMQPFSWELFENLGVETLFLATPHEFSREAVPAARKRGIRVIDLSGAWRLEEASNRAIYRFEDEGSATALTMQSEAVYGMPELHREKIRGAELIANPGCYATSVILALKPLIAAGMIDVEHGVIADSKSGVSGAGKAPTAKTHFMSAADNLSTYAVFGHRHTGELLEQLGLENGEITFTPHLLPIPRGILSTIYVRFRSKQSQAAVEACYAEFFKTSPMVRLYGSELPQIQYSVRTNYCDIGVKVAADGRRGIVVSCLDNLLKGAAGQAVQNLNVAMGWGEAEGLE
ncbi:MAG TPA: N-acetyl-gamma-glutamyl-phosphate reductase [Acidobacteriaceae bacterium]|nr:N-acetyl-gamma-glutamyl-phosphate reductase [Acidobacteriaceae bacterium]